MKRLFTYCSLSVGVALVLAAAGLVNAGSPTPDTEVVPFGSTNITYLHPAAYGIDMDLDGNGVIDPGFPEMRDSINYDPFNSQNQPNFDFEWYKPTYTPSDLVYGDGTVIPWENGGSLPIGYDTINAFENSLTGTLGLATALATPDSGDRFTTYYRIPINVSGGGAGPWVMEYLSDDGAAFYLDGNPLIEVNCCEDAGGVEITDGTEPWFTTFAINTGTEDNLQTVVLDGLNNLSNGNHLLAVSLHQASTTSSDTGLDFRIFKPGSGRPWGVDASGDWADAANWSIDPADTNSEFAVFGSVYTAPHTIWTNSAVNVDGVQFDSLETYNIAGTGSVNINDGGLNALAGNHSFQVNVRLNNNLDADIAADSSIDFNNRFDLNGRTLTKAGAGDIIVGNTANTGSGTLVVNEGGVAGSGVIAGDLNVGGGTIAPGGMVVPVASSTTLTVNGDANVTAGGISLNVYGNGNGDAVSGGGGGNLTVAGAMLNLLVDAAYTPSTGDSFEAFPGWGAITGISAPADWSFNAADGTLTYTGGGGVDPCDLDADGDCDVADIDALTNQAGVTRAEIETWLADAGTKNGFSGPLLFGDSNLDGAVNASDLNDLGQNWQASGTMWSTGDFTGDDVTNASDLNEIGQNWQQVVPAAAAASAVPEPASLSLLLFAVLGLVGLRRQAR